MPVKDRATTTIQRNVYSLPVLVGGLELLGTVASVSRVDIEDDRATDGHVVRYGRSSTTERLNDNVMNGRVMTS